MSITVVNVRGLVKSNGKAVYTESTIDDGYADAPDIDGLVNGTALRPLEDFNDKDALEAYGLTFGINLMKNKKLENMYADLKEFVESK
jgi:hypothetical protein